MRTLGFATLALLTTACFDTDKSGDGEGDTGAVGDGADGASDGADGSIDTAEPHVSGTIGGTVTVQLYNTADDGVREELAWGDSAYSSEGVVTWPFGELFVAAYTTDGGHTDYIGSTSIDAPSENGDAYEIDWSMPGGTGDVYVYAALDRDGDTVIGSGDPTGVYPLPLSLADGDTITGIDITVLAAPLSGGGGGCAGTVSVSGDVLLTVNTSGGNAIAMLVSPSGAGPYHADIVSPTTSPSGATAAYSFDACANYGSMNLIGAWDRNQDGLFAPDDAWGAYAPSADTDGNPVLVGSSDLSGYDVQVPLGDSPGISVVPFVRVTGAVSMQDGSSFDSLSAGATVYVAALKYRPGTDFDISTSSDTYDVHEVPWADLTGNSSLPYSLVVPADTIAYVWAYADEDVDGVVNEPSEHVASASSDNGRVNTGTANVSGVDLQLGVALGE